MKSILKRVTEDQGKRAADQLAAERAEARKRQEQQKAVDEIITQHMQRVADDMDAEMTVLTREVVLPKYFTLGDIVVKVELFQSAPSDPDVDKPHLVVTEFCVSIVGLDGERIISRRVGMLAIFCYESVYQTLTDQSFGNFEATEVLKKLDF